ncbi:MAG: hypothetical protein EBR23_02625, partial [Planctomycetia bacterium]|nr:hypothetical protein [Planctomycetia bacterium]
ESVVMPLSPSGPWCRDRAVATSSEIVRRPSMRNSRLTCTLVMKLRATPVRICTMPGVTVTVEGDVNDYCGKGLSGGRVIVRPSRDATFKAEDNVIAGNVVAYGATSGELFIRGICGERFCVRNSGAEAVVEGTGDHGCEYMTGGRAVVLGETGRNFAAGMSGGIAYVWDAAGTFRSRVNTEMVELEPLDAGDLEYVRSRIEKHVHHTDSPRGGAILERWVTEQKKFVKVMPIDYKRALAELRKFAEQEQQEARQAEVKAHG